MRLIAVVVTGMAAWALSGAALGPRVPPVRPRRVGAALGAALGAGGLASSLAPPSVALVAAAAGSVVPGAALRAIERRERHRRAEAWPDLLATVRSRLAAGDDLASAVIAGARGPLAPLAEAVERGRRSGTDLERSLDDLRDAWADPVADRVVVTLGAAARAGGSRVADLVAALGESVADELRLRRTHEAETTQQRLTAAVALAAPWVLLAFTIATNPQAASAFARPAGTLVVAVGGVATALGAVLTRRTLTLSEPERVFR